MTFPKRLIHVLELLLLSAVPALAQQSPEPNPPTIENKAIHAKGAPIAAAGPTLYSVGDPTDEEQLFLELINRSRTDAVAEANRLLTLTDINILANLIFYGVDTNVMKSQFATNPPAAPLSFNSKLINSARAHNQYQFDTVQQTHTGSGGSMLADRFNAVGYVYFTGGENVFSQAQNVEHGHAGFEIDWGPGPSGMQTPPGHRNTIHNQVLTEIGIGVIKGSNTNVTTVTNNGVVSTVTNRVGPMLVTQDFGAPLTPTTFITGVAYYDLNGNNFYDLGEGLGGITVTVDGRDTYAVTTTSGAYSIPVPPNASYTVHFQPPNTAQTSTSITLNSTNNYKLDYKPAFVPTAVTAMPSILFTGASNLINLASLPGATGYRARVQQLAPPVVQTAESGFGDMIPHIDGTNSVIAANVGAVGNHAYRLIHIANLPPPGIETLQFGHRFYVKPNARVDFRSRLGVAYHAQFARLEASADDGATWTALWSQAGSNDFGQPDNSEKTFSAKTGSLAAFEGKVVKIRFSFSPTPGESYIASPPDSDPNAFFYGWYIDDLTVVNADQVTGTTLFDAGSNAAFEFNPASTGNYVLDFQALSGARTYPFGPTRFVTAQANPPVLSLVNNIASVNGTVSFQFTVTSGTLTPFAVNSASSITGPWARETGAAITGPVSGKYTVTVPSNGAARFYRVLAN